MKLCGYWGKFIIFSVCVFHRVGNLKYIASYILVQHRQIKVNGGQNMMVDRAITVFITQ